MISYLKLGGSLITDKDKPHTTRPEIIQRLAAEIREAQKALPNHQWLIGHGSGSFGHVPASHFGTRRGVRTEEEWKGFLEVWREARVLNQIMIDSLAQAGIPVISFPPSAILSSAQGKLSSIYVESIKSALLAGLTPLVAGDVIFDSATGGTIFSTEDIFFELALRIPPARILLCGKDEGVCGNFPDCNQVVPEISPSTYHQISSTLNSSASIDVTGGMREKVGLMVKLVKQSPAVEAMIFSGLKPGNLFRAMMGEKLGTTITNKKENRS